MNIENIKNKPRIYINCIDDYLYIDYEDESIFESDLPFERYLSKLEYQLKNANSVLEGDFYLLFDCLDTNIVVSSRVFKKLKLNEKFDNLLRNSYNKLVKNSKNHKLNYSEVIEVSEIIHQSYVDRLSKNIQNKKTKVSKKLKTMFALTLSFATLVSASKLSKLFVENQNELLKTLEDEEITLETDVYEKEISEVIDLTKPEENIIEENQELEINIDEFNEVDSRLKAVPSSSNVGSELSNATTKEFLVNKIDSQTGTLIFKYATDYGIDPYLLLAIGMGESTLNNDIADGMFQHVNADDAIIEAFNYTTNETDSVTRNAKAIKNVETNIQMAVMLQNYLVKFEGNIRMSLQSYNFGTGFIQLVLTKYSEQYGVHRNELARDYNWIEYTDDIAQIDNNAEVRREYLDSLSDYVKENHPLTISSLYQRSGNGYGNANYYDHIMKNYIGDMGVFILNGEHLVYDYVNNCYIPVTVHNNEISR